MATAVKQVPYPRFCSRTPQVPRGGLRSNRATPPVPAEHPRQSRLSVALSHLGPPALHPQPDRQERRSTNYLPSAGKSARPAPSTTTATRTAGWPSPSAVCWWRTFTSCIRTSVSRQVHDQGHRNRGDERVAPLRRRSLRAGPPRLQSPRVQSARCQPARLFAPLRHLRRLLRRARHLRRNQTALHHRIRKTNVTSAAAKTCWSRDSSR